MSRRPIAWTPEMLETLRDMRERGYSMERCAERVGVYVAGVERKCRELGLNARRHRGSLSGERTVAFGLDKFPPGRMDFWERERVKRAAGDLQV